MYIQVTGCMLDFRLPPRSRWEL